MRLFIGCAAYRDMDAKTAMSQQRMTQGGTEVPGVTEIATAVAMGYHAPRNGEQLAQMAIDGGFTHYLYHDADIEYGVRHVARALESLQFVQGATKVRNCVVGAMYPSSSGPGVLVGKPDTSDPSWTNFVPGQTIGEAEHVGFGFVVMPTSIFFSGMPKPWFADEWNGIHNELITPDVRFCRVARATGCRVFADSALDVIHWVRMPLTIRDCLARLNGGQR